MEYNNQVINVNEMSQNHMASNSMDEDNGNMLKQFNDPSYTMTDEEDIYDGNDGTGATYG